MDDRKIESEPEVKDYVIEEEDGRFVSLKARNEKLGLTMSVVPFMVGMDGTRSDRELEVMFTHTDGGNVSDSGNVKIISTGWLLGLKDEQSPPIKTDLVKVIFEAKHVPFFQGVVSFTDYDDLVDQVFPGSDTGNS